MKDENERKIERLEAEIERLKSVCDEWAEKYHSWVKAAEEAETARDDLLLAAETFDRRLDAEVKRAVGLTWGQAQHAFHDANAENLHYPRQPEEGCPCVWPTLEEQTL